MDKLPIHKVTFFDRALATVAPKFATNRIIARARFHEFAYDMANPGTRRSGSGGLAKNAASENYRSHRDRINLMWDARDMVRNFAILRGIVARLVQYVADKVQYVSTTGDEMIDGAYQDYFHEWCETADLSGRYRLGDLVYLMLWGTFTDGDHGWKIVELDEETLKIQPIEADRIGNPNESLKANDDNYIAGIHIDDMGAPVTYDIFKRQRNNKYSFEGEVPADQFIHFLDPLRVDQYRGVTPLATALAPARDLYDIFLTEKQAAKWQSGQAGVITSNDPFKSTGGNAFQKGDTSGATNKPGTMVMEPGKIHRLAEGESVNFTPAMTRPNGAFMSLVEVMVREISIGLNLPYGFVYDMSALSGHTGRIEVAQAMRTIRRWQTLLAERVLDKVRDHVLSRAISLGKLPAHPKWRSGKWGFGASLTGDYGNDVSANLQLLQQGIITASDMIAERGGTFEEVARRSAAEMQFLQRTAGETSIPIELMLQRWPNATQALAAINTPPPPAPEPPPGMVGEQGEKGVQPLLDILEAVGTGVMDRASAVQTLVQLYALPPATAEKMVPQAPKAAPAGASLGSPDKPGNVGSLARKTQKEE
ncbi:MAG: phage portal protein [Verrucomicrobiota bacterium]